MGNEEWGALWVMDGMDGMDNMDGMDKVDEMGKVELKHYTPL